MNSLSIVFFLFIHFTGIAKKHPLTYIVGTLSGHLECVQIKIKSNVITIDTDELKPPNGHSKYALYGLTTSTNNAFFLGAYFAGRVKTFDQINPSFNVKNH